MNETRRNGANRLQMLTEFPGEACRAPEYEPGRFCSTEGCGRRINGYNRSGLCPGCREMLRSMKLSKDFENQVTRLTIDELPNTTGKPRRCLLSECHKLFYPNPAAMRPHLFCSPRCGGRYQYLKKKAMHSPIPPKPCPYCGKDFIPVNAQQVYCGYDCRQAQKMIRLFGHAREAR